MQSVTAVSSMVVLCALLGSSRGVHASETFTLLVNHTTGQVAITSEFSSTVWIDQYIITSAAGSLKPATWFSLYDQSAPPGSWLEAANAFTVLSESTVFGETSFQNGTGFNIGPCFNIFFSQDLVFHYRLAGSATPSLGVVTYLSSFSPPPAPVQQPMPCTGDINSNKTVDVDDLLAVINAWGSCPPPSRGETCPADIAPAQFGNGTVNVDDLLTVINAWGPCR